MHSPKVHGAKRTPSFLAVLRDLQLSMAADEPVLCDCDEAMLQHDCA